MSYRPKLVKIEPAFDAFVKSWDGACRIDALFPDADKAGKNADYFFQNERVVVELKCLEGDPSDTIASSKRLNSILRKAGYGSYESFRISTGADPMPEAIGKKLYSSTQNAMRNALRKANKQVAATKNLVGSDVSGLLLMANDRDHLFNPIEALRCLSGMALRLTECHLDGIVYTTPNVFYDDGSGYAQQYWAPVYDEGKEHLSDFVNPLGRAWLEFLADYAGETAKLTQVSEIRDTDTTARPIRWQDR